MDVATNNIVIAPRSTTAASSPSGPSPAGFEQPPAVTDTCGQRAADLFASFHLYAAIEL